MVNFKVGLLMRLLEHGTISDKLMHFHIAFSNYLLTFWILYRISLELTWGIMNITLSF